MSEPWSSTVLCVLPCCRAYMARDRRLDKGQKPSGVRGSSPWGVDVYSVVRSEICGPEALEAGGWIHSTGTKAKVLSPRFDRRTPRIASTPPCLWLAAQCSALDARTTLCPTRPCVSDEAA